METMTKYRSPCGETFYHVGPIHLVRYSGISALRAAYGEGTGRHFFEPSTLKHFGSRNGHIPPECGGAIYVELQTRAPKCSRYAVTAWEIRDGSPSPMMTCSHDTLAHARTCATAWWAMFKPDADHSLMLSN